MNKKERMEHSKKLAMRLHSLLKMAIPVIFEEDELNDLIYSVSYNEVCIDFSFVVNSKIFGVKIPLGGIEITCVHDEYKNCAQMKFEILCYRRI